MLSKSKIIIQCEICSKRVETTKYLVEKKNKRFCSLKCSGVAKMGLIPACVKVKIPLKKNCFYCNKIIYTKRKNQRFCARECYAKYWNEQIKPRLWIAGTTWAKEIGKKRADAVKEFNRKKMLKQWANPGYRQKMVKAHIGQTPCNKIYVDMELLKKLYMDEKIPTKVICQKMRIKQCVLNRILREYEFPKRSKTYNSKYYQMKKEKFKAEIIQRCLKGESARSIGKKIGIGGSTIILWLKGWEVNKCWERKFNRTKTGCFLND